ncbi:fas apoptotic inhibitory molecule 1-like [Centruroides sculpturatus]|uniref:fas apoptotic inhibitory molecule 1-like n=1 Tax=Centruroides sculpturatus TaxID=218467 RepID=UPI000C6E64A6|nr:fas apoptotic inhibitory molecule 1-like [Centruroides sculpturatus]XP_023220837.1 fas apoptotic inhibitory molecule 1-like [Centruroides sculpturatus]
MSSDLIGVWEVRLSDRVHRVEFEHGTASGRRVLRVDGKEILRRDWMFRLVGSETFEIGKTKCCINIRPTNGFNYEYTLSVNGRELQKFLETQSKILKTWILDLDGEATRVVLEKDTLDVWVNGQKVDTAGEFVEDGTETHFSLGCHEAYIKAISSGKKKEGIIHVLIVDNMEIPESIE